MPIHVVKQGECFATIAQAHGLRGDALYKHPDNAALRKKRPNPNILHPGDEVAIPEREPKELSVPSGAKHRFKVKVSKRELRLRLLDHGGDPIAGAAYVLEADGERVEGKTTGDGEIVEAISSGARTATLTVGARVLVLECAALDPLTDAPDEGVSGARERLRNLGYDVGEASSELDPRTRTALALFQHEAKIDVTGKLDDATRARLGAAHRC